MMLGRYMLAIGAAGLLASVPVWAKVSLSSRGTHGSDAQGVGLKAETGIVIVNVRNTSTSKDPKNVNLAHDSNGFELDMKGGVRCKFNFGVTRAGFFLGGKELRYFSPKGKPREKHYNTQQFIPASQFKKSGLDPVKVVYDAMYKHIDKGGSKTGFLRKDRNFTVELEPEFKGRCVKKVKFKFDSGGLYHRAAKTSDKVKVYVRYAGDADLGRYDRAKSPPKRDRSTHSSSAHRRQEPVK